MNRNLHPQSATRYHRVPGLVPLLIVALLWAQMLGLAHRVLHAPQLQSAPRLEQSAMHQATAPAGLLEHLFAPATGEPDCRAYDQLGQSHALPALPAQDLPALQPSLLDVMARVTVCRPAAALFEARGPPAFR